MKKILTAVALAALIASPAMAKSKRSQVYHNTNDAYAYAGDYTAVIVDGKIIGRDPDPFIRDTLRRDGGPSRRGAN